jgi:hypothetical protein
LLIRLRDFARRAVLHAVGRALGRRHREALDAAWYAAQAGHPVGQWPTAYRAALRWSRGDAEGAEPLWQQLENTAPLAALWPLQRSVAARLRGDPMAQERILSAACDRGVDDPVLVERLEQARQVAGATGSQDAEALKLVDAASTPAAPLFWASVHLSSIGRFEQARTGLQRLIANSRLSWEAQVQLLALDLIERYGTDQLTPGWFSPKRSSALVQTRSDTLLVVFLPPGGSFGLSANPILAMLGPEPPNVLYLYDSQTLFHLNGTDRFGAGYGAMIDGISTCAAEIGASRLMTLARCAPGYTAIRAGIDLAADRVIAISPVTTITPEDMHEDGRTPVLQRRLTEIVPEQSRDLLPDIRAQTRTDLRIFYNRAHERDRGYAERLRGADCVTLYPLEEPLRRDPTEKLLRGAERSILQAMVGSGRSASAA